MEQKDEQMAAIVDKPENNDLKEFTKWMFQNYPEAANKYSEDDDGGMKAIEGYIEMWKQELREFALSATSFIEKLKKVD